MKIIKSIFLIAIATVVFTSCSSEEESNSEPIIANRALNIYAPVETDYTVNPPTEAGEFTKFSFSEGTTVTGENWDIAFRGTTILVNGGVEYGFTDEPIRTGDVSLAILTGAFSDIVEIPEGTQFTQDAEGTLALPKGSWYTYSGPPSHKISPVAGQVFIIKTTDENYVKMEIRSYYKDMDDSNSADQVNSGARYYTFDYIYNPNADDKSLE